MEKCVGVWGNEGGLEKCVGVWEKMWREVWGSAEEVWGELRESV